MITSALISRFDALESARTYARPALGLRRRERLLATASGLFRGAAALFYECALQHPDAVTLAAQSPARWVVGDVHLENIGAVYAGEKHYHFDLNDFDETARCPPAWDLLRGASACALAAEDLGYEDGTARVVNAFLQGYETPADQPLPPVAEVLLVEAAAVGTRELLDARCNKSRTKLKADHDGYLPLDAREKSRCHTVLQGYIARAPHRSLGAKTRLLDAMFRVQGTGSLGCERYAMLIERDDAKTYLLDAKEMRASALVSARIADAGDETHAQRVEAGLLALVGSLRDEARAVTLDDGVSFLVRRYAPGERKVKLDARRINLQTLYALASTLGARVKEAHLRADPSRTVNFDAALARETALDLAAVFRRLHSALRARA